MIPDPATLRAVCVCGEHLWARRQGAWTLRAAILRLDEDGGMTARCPACKSEVAVPFLALCGPAPVPIAPTPPPGRIHVRRRIAS